MKLGEVDQFVGKAHERQHQQVAHDAERRQVLHFAQHHPRHADFVFRAQGLAQHGVGGLAALGRQHVYGTS